MSSAEDDDEMEDVQHETAPSTPGDSEHDEENDEDEDNTNNDNEDEVDGGDEAAAEEDEGSRVPTEENNEESNVGDVAEEEEEDDGDAASKTDTATVPASPNNDEGEEDEEADDDGKKEAIDTPSASLKPATVASDAASADIPASAVATPPRSASNSTAAAPTTPATGNSNSKDRKRKGMPAGLGGSRKGRAPAVSGLTIPFRTVKKAMKLDPDIPIVQNEAAIMTTLAAELFLNVLAHESHSNAKARGRNTIRYEDVAEARTKKPALSFLETLLP